jgi:hypothetical protein
MAIETPTVVDLLSEFEERCDAIEECYEFMLAFAGKGLPSDSGSQVRYHLERAAQALRHLPDVLARVAEKEQLEPAAKYQAFGNVLKRDAADSLAAIELVLAQSVISSQLIDNLNASIHLRALLTDIFLIDGILADRSRSVPVVGG